MNILSLRDKFRFINLSIISLFLCILSFSKTYSHTLDEFNYSIREIPSGIKLTSNISHAVEPDELKALGILKQEISALSIYQDGVKCLPSDDFSNIPTEASLKSVTASVTFICAGDYQQFKIERTTPQVVRANFIVIWDNNWSGAVFEPGSMQIIIKTLSPAQRFLGFMKKGFMHFASGLDHIIFLLTIFISVLLERRIFGKIYKYAIVELSLFTAGHASASYLSYSLTCYGEWQQENKILPKSLTRDEI